MTRPRVPIGIKPSPHTFQSFQDDDQSIVQNFTNLKYDKVLLPITNMKYRLFCKDKFKDMYQRQDDPIIPPPQLSQVNITEGPHMLHVIGLISSWIEIDTSNQFINEFCLQVLNHELNYANFLGIKVVLISPPKNLENLSIFTNILNKLLLKFPNLTISVSLPICEEPARDPETGNVMTSLIDSLSTWDMWNSIRVHCHYNPKLTVSLLLPRGKIPSYVINRWLVEPVSIFLISTLVFIKNSKDFPVFHKLTQFIIWKFIQYNWNNSPILLLHGVDKLSQQDDLSYQDYLNYIIKVTNENLPLNSLLKLSLEYSHLNLQIPLQPLLHDLDNTTYKIFENNDAKYESYESAMTRLIRDLDTSTHLSILVAGPGRGPLIDRLFQSLHDTNIKDFHIVLVEKNPNAIIYLQNRNLTHWQGQVEIIHLDCRTYQSDTKFRMVVSEMLGSFGDNELFPECLYPLQQNGNCSTDCIFIPQDVATFVAPVMAPKVYSQLLSQQNERNYHQPYLILLNQFEILSTKSHEIWNFNHHRQTYKKLSKDIFKCKHKGIIHGIIGYFELTLYLDIKISNNPSQPTPTDLNSWLPIFFPLETPILISDEQEVELTMRRDCEVNKVWYEWSLEIFVYLALPETKGSEVMYHNSIFGNLIDEKRDWQVRLRTGVSRIHNLNGLYHSMRLP